MGLGQWVSCLQELQEHLQDHQNHQNHHRGDPGGDPGCGSGGPGGGSSSSGAVPGAPGDTKRILLTESVDFVSVKRLFIEKGAHTYMHTHS